MQDDMSSFVHAIAYTQFSMIGGNLISRVYTLLGLLTPYGERYDVLPVEYTTNKI